MWHERAERELPERRARAAARVTGSSDEQDQILRLQRSAGNAAVQRLIRQRTLQRVPLGAPAPIVDPAPVAAEPAADVEKEQGFPALAHVGFVALLAFECALEQVLGEGGVCVGSNLGEVEEQAEVQQVRADAQGFVQDPVGSDAVDRDAGGQQLVRQVGVADGSQQRPRHLAINEILLRPPTQV